MLTNYLEYNRQQSIKSRAVGTVMHPISFILFRKSLYLDKKLPLLQYEEKSVSQTSLTLMSLLDITFLFHQPNLGFLLFLLFLLL